MSTSTGIPGVINASTDKRSASVLPTAANLIDKIRRSVATVLVGNVTGLFKEKSSRKEDFETRQVRNATYFDVSYTVILINLSNLVLGNLVT